MENKTTTVAMIPEEFKPCFWDTDFYGLDIQRNKYFIIPRMYNKGGIRGISWVHQTYTDEDIITAAKRCRDFHPIVANYLKQKYNINPQEMIYYQLDAIGGHELWQY